MIEVTGSGDREIYREIERERESDVERLSEGERERRGEIYIEREEREREIDR